MPIKKVDFKKVEKKILDNTVKKLRLEASEIIVGIVLRTQKGKDVNNRSFKPYSKKYKEFKKDSGRGVDINLTYAGRMLGAINSKTIPQGVTFYFNSQEERDKARKNQKARKFFGMDKKQIKELKKKISSIKK